MFLTDNNSGVVLYVGHILKQSNFFGIPVYVTPEYSYPQSTTMLHDEDIDVVAGKNTYIDGVIGINPNWSEPEEPITPEPTQLDNIENTQLTIMTALAEQYEESLERELTNMEVQATIYEAILELGGAE